MGERKIDAEAATSRNYQENEVSSDQRSHRREVDEQRAYYRGHAEAYDGEHLTRDPEHYVALAFMTSIIDLLDIRSVLDVGAGTGRVHRHLRSIRPHVQVVGVEPSLEMREQAYLHGIASETLVDGDALQLPFKAGSFQLVCEYGSLHHIPDPTRAVSEMLRVASRGVFISDCNNFGQGRLRLAKWALHGLGLWRAAKWVRSGGRGYLLSDGDGLAYSYSVFSNYTQIEEACSRVHILNTAGSGPNLVRSASHVALAGIK